MSLGLLKKLSIIGVVLRRFVSSRPQLWSVRVVRARGSRACRVERKVVLDPVPSRVVLMTLAGLRVRVLKPFRVVR